MFFRTHLLVTLLAVLFFIPSVENKFVFAFFAFLATLIPDIDTAYSKIGHYKFFKPLHFFVKHRGVIHSFVFLFSITLFFVLFYPIAAAGFFLGYSLHLFLDSFTIEGIKPFYPWGKGISGKIRTGGKTETSLFIILLLCCVFMILIRVSFLFD